VTERTADYRPDIDGLRAVAVGVVIVYHAFPQLLPGGFTGVDVFFVISGYLISGIILSALAANRFSYSHFYARRIRRIFPALAMVLGAVAAIGWFTLYADDYARLGRHIAGGAGFVSNFVLWRESSYFDTAVELKPLLHLWSLGIEEQFYLVWPLMLVTSSRWRLGPLTLTAVVGAISFLASIWQVRIDPTPAFFSPWARFWELLAGATLACVEIDRELKLRLEQALSPQRRNALATAGAAMIAAGVILIDGTRVFPGLWVLLPVVGTFLLLVAGPHAWLNRRVLSLRPIVWIGLISYALYLWHWPLLSFARIIGGEPPSAALRLALIAVSVGLASMTYLLVEWPVRFGSRSRNIVPALATAMLTLFVLGLTTNTAAGFIERPINRSDAAGLVDYYARMHRTGIARTYRRECDFMDWVTEATRDAIDPSCTTPGRAFTVLLWGDSYAQALSQGIREQLPTGGSLAQVTTSACSVAIDNFNLTVRDRRCEKTNLYAMAAIGRLRPKLVIIAQSTWHALVDWPRVAARTRELGAERVMVVGPFPVWVPSLPRVFAEHHLNDQAEYVGRGIDGNLFAIDRQVAAKLAGLPDVTYLSLLEKLCRNDACLARVPGEGDRDLMALDAGHLTPKGSTYVGRTVFQPVLASLGAR